MDIRFASWILILHVLFLMCGHGNGVGDFKENNVLLLPQSRDFDAAVHDHENHMMHHHMDHTEAIKVGFFTMDDLYAGKIMQILLPPKNPSSPTRFLPKDVADSIPLSSSELPNLLKHFSITEGSPSAKAMKKTLTDCEREPIKGETKICAASFESMLDFVRGVFGFEANISVAATRHRSPAASRFQKYTIMEDPKEIPAAKMIGCHPNPYPYAVFYCHTQTTGTKVFKLLLLGENGDEIDTVSVCHLDTSGWDPNYSKFRMLGVKPGTPVCHFFPPQHLVWYTPAPATV